MPLSEASRRLCEKHTMHYIRRVGISTSASWWAGSCFREQHIRQIELETELGCQLAIANYYVRETESMCWWTSKGTLGTHPSCLPIRHKPQYAGGGGRREATGGSSYLAQHETFTGKRSSEIEKRRTDCMRHSIFVLRQKKKISTLPHCIASEGAKPSVSKRLLVGGCVTQP